MFIFHSNSVSSFNSWISIECGWCTAGCCWFESLFLAFELKANWWGEMSEWRWWRRRRGRKNSQQSTQCSCITLCVLFRVSDFSRFPLSALIWLPWAIRKSAYKQCARYLMRPSTKQQQTSSRTKDLSIFRFLSIWCDITICRSNVRISSLFADCVRRDVVFTGKKIMAQIRARCQWKISICVYIPYYIGTGERLGGQSR